MNKSISYITVLLSLVGMMVACEHEPTIPPLISDNNPTDTNGNGGGGNSIPCDPDTIYFSKDVLPILRSNCAFSGCHGDGSAKDGVDLTTYQSVMNTADVRPFDLNGSDLYEAITDNDLDKRMPPPPAAALSAAQIAIIAKWINQGALNKSCDGCDTTSVTFALTISPIIKNNCQGCHSGGSPRAGISLTNYNEIKNQVNTGALFAVVNHIPPYTPMPYNQSKLNDCLVTQINKWIDEGAQNN